MMFVNAYEYDLDGLRKQSVELNWEDDKPIRESLLKTYRYPIACRELSFILREAFHQFPKNLQSIVFQDTLSAFRLLPEYVMLFILYLFVSLIKIFSQIHDI